MRNSFFPCNVRKALVRLLLSVAFILSLIWISVPIMEWYLIVDQPLQSADALVVMAGSMEERLPAVALLYKNKVADKILLTNDGVPSAFSEEKHRNLYQIEWAELDLLKTGIPKNAIFQLSHTTSGTIYDALNTRAAVLDKGIKSIIIVTSDYHTKRSLWIFKRVFKEYPVKIGVYSVTSRVTALPLLDKFVTLGYEVLKLLFYRCNYGDIE